MKDSLWWPVMVSVRRTNHPRENDMTRCIAILALALTSTLFADQSPAAEGDGLILRWSNLPGIPGDIKDGRYWEVLLDMGFSPEEADYILLAGTTPYTVFIAPGRLEFEISPEEDNSCDWDNFPGYPADWFGW